MLLKQLFYNSLQIDKEESIINNIQNPGRLNNSALRIRRFLTIQGVPMLLKLFFDPCLHITQGRY